MKFMPLKTKLTFLWKSVKVALNELTSLKINSFTDFIRYSSVGINSMVLNIRLFMSSYVASIILFIVTKNFTTENKFDRNKLDINIKYQLMHLGLLLIALILF